MKKDKAIEDSLFLNKAYKELVIIFGISLIFLIFAHFFNFYDILRPLINESEEYKIDELIISTALFSILLLIFSLRRIREIKLANIKRIKIERELFKANSLLKAVVDGVPELVMYIDRNRKVIWANKATFEMKPDALGELLLPDLQNIRRTFGIDCFCERTFETGETEKGITRQPAFKDVTAEIYYDGTSIPVKDKIGRVVGIVLVVRDITERMPFEDSRNKLESILEASDFAIVNLSLGGAILSWNDGAFRLYGYDSSEIIGQPVSLLITQGNYYEIRSSIERILRGEYVPSYQATRIRNDGRIIFVNQTLKPLYNHARRIIGVTSISNDITYQKNLEDINSENQAYIQVIINNINNGLLILNKSFIILTWNKFLEDLTNLNSEKVIGRKYNHIYTGFIENIDIQLLNDILEGNNSSVQTSEPFKELKFKSNAGREFFIRLIPKLSVKNYISGIIIFVEEINLNSLRIAESKNEKVYDNISDCYVYLNKEFIITEFNNTMAEHFNLNENNIIGKHILNEVIPNFKSTIFEEKLAQLMYHNNPERFEFRNIKNNSENWYDIHFYPDNFGMKLFITPKTQLKLFEKALFEKDERYSSLAQSMRAIAMRLTLDLNLHFIYGAVSGITGYNETDFLSKSIVWFDIVYKEDLFYVKDNFKKACKERGYEYEMEYRIVSKEGNIRWLNQRLNNISDSNGVLTYIQGTVYDITTKKEAEIELKRSREQLRTLAFHVESLREAEKKQIAFEIHDELGHALTALKLDLGWILNKRYLKEEVIQDRIKECSKQIDTLIRKVRAISSELRPSILDHFGIIAAIEWQAKEFQKRTAIRCKVYVEPPEIILDENRSIVVFRMVQEALTNIARHAQATRVDISLTQIGTELEVKVSDNGVGINQEDMNNKKSLGLIGIKERAYFIGGMATIGSVLDYGTTITIKIPTKN